MSDSTPILIATRGSALALAQANTVLNLCSTAFPTQRFELRIIKTTGDKLQTASLASSELPKGLFTKEIEEALVRREADLAVHSLKDLPTELPEGLVLGATLKRADVRDVLVWRLPKAGASGEVPGTDTRAAARSQGLAVLPRGATVATSSTRRRAQLRDLRPDLNIVPIRGNVDTRLRKVAEQEDIDATILAAAGLNRLGFQIHPDGQLVDHRQAETGSSRAKNLGAVRAGCLEWEEILPCVGQAAIGIEVRGDHERVRPLLKMLDDVETHQCVTAERAFLAGMGGGCQLAVAALARIEAGRLHLRAISFLGEKPRRGEIQGQPDAAAQLGAELAAQVL